MNRKEAEAKLEFLETTVEEKAHGLRRIKRRHLTAPGEVTLKDCRVRFEIGVDADVLKFFEDQAGEENIEAEINRILREKMENATKTEIGGIRRALLNDTEFLQELKEKLAA